MKILLNDPPPLLSPLTVQKAGILLMANAHLTFIGAMGIPEHRDFVDSLVARLPGPCNLFVTQEPDWRWAPHQEMKVVVTQAVELGRPEYALVFAPDNVENRLATMAVALKYGGLAAVRDLTAHRGPAPIVLLPAPGESDLSVKLEQAYILVIEGLRAVAEGRALDVSRN